MAKRVSVDRWLFTVTMLLVFVGLVMVFSASAVMARERFGSPYAFLSKQLIWAVAGLGAIVVAMRVDYRRYKHPALGFSLMGLTTLLLISGFFLDRSHHTHRWIHWGGFSLPPSELAKPALILSLVAVSTGGVTGTGLMEGKQKLFYLREPRTDFISAVTAEELGLVGALFVVALFAIFLWRGMRVSWRTEDVFGRYLAVGITSMVVLQAFVNISVVLGMMPTKGIPLPLVSYCGASFFVA